MKILLIRVKPGDLLDPSALPPIHILPCDEPWGSRSLAVGVCWGEHPKGGWDRDTWDRHSVFPLAMMRPRQTWWPQSHKNGSVSSSVHTGQKRSCGGAITKSKSESILLAACMRCTTITLLRYAPPSTQHDDSANTQGVAYYTCKRMWYLVCSHQ